jgi:hypothetical protein
MSGGPLFDGLPFWEKASHILLTVLKQLACDSSGENLDRGRRPCKSRATAPICRFGRPCGTAQERYIN